MPEISSTSTSQEIEAPAGTTILNAALARGKEIPHFCYHPGLSIAGNCRMCLVEVEKAPKPAIACKTPIAEGMVVTTDSARIKEAQQAVMEFLLINHPLDCPICDQAGECKLQDQAVEYGTGVSRYTEPQARGLPRIFERFVGPGDDDSVQSTRYVGFGQEIAGVIKLGMIGRGGLRNRGH